MISSAAPTTATTKAIHQKNGEKNSRRSLLFWGMWHTRIAKLAFG